MEWMTIQKRHPQQKKGSNENDWESKKEFLIEKRKRKKPSNSNNNIELDYKNYFEHYLKNSIMKIFTQITAKEIIPGDLLNVFPTQSPIENNFTKIEICLGWKIPLIYQVIIKKSIRHKTW